MAQNRGGSGLRELARVEIGDNVWLIVSRRQYDGKIVMASGNMVQADGHTKMMYNAISIVISSVEGVGKAGDCLLDVYEKLNPEQITPAIAKE